MDGNTARTILSLNDQRDRLQEEKRQALLAQAEMTHELNMLRHMRSQIVGTLLERNRNRGTEKSARHTVSKIARIIRNGQSDRPAAG